MPRGIQGISVVPPAQPRSNNEQLRLASVGGAEVRSEPHLHGCDSHGLSHPASLLDRSDKVNEWNRIARDRCASCDELRQRDRRIAELRDEIDELRDLVRRMTEDVEDADNVLEQWRETFDMKLTDNGWTWKPFWDEYAKLHEKYFDLVNFNSGRDIPNLGGAP
jgi:chromosome segregation ATPase